MELRHKDFEAVPDAMPGAGDPSRACLQIWKGTMHLVVADEVPMNENIRFRIAEPLWERFKKALDRVGAPTFGATTPTATRASAEG